ncbi:MAG: hypothetical protein RLY86_2001 [Pseudomonadota bacterium]|jgi:dimethylhistidine N-methyltransferase
MPTAPLRHLPRAGFLDLAPAADSFLDAVLAGLSRRPRTIPPKFFYDAEGSRLFDAITDLPEYYPTRTEIGILDRSGAEMASVLGQGVHLVELGSGSGVKVGLLLRHLAAPSGYVGIDISGDHLRTACDRLAADWPGLDVLELCADYTGGDVMAQVPAPAAGQPGRRVAFFPGSTIGNMEPGEAEAFLARWRRWLANPGGRGGGMLVGVDLRKDRDVLRAAYNDRAGVTAAFNLNLLARMNRELGAAIDPAAFTHRAIYAEDAGRIEMHLASTRDQIVTIAGRRFAFAAGETIHTENSYKYTVDGFRALAVRAGYRPARVWTDPDALFSLHWLEA